MLLSVFFMLVTLISQAQVDAPLIGVDFQQNPSIIQWKKIDSEHFEIIFPEEVEREAQRVTFLLEKAYPYVTRSLQTNPPKISLILQNQSLESNGFVTLAPRRSEWFMTPAIDPELNNTEWLKTLAIHEFRHVVQFQKTRQGFNRVLEILFGEVGHAVGLGLSLPPWYYEGDAVGIETALTQGGRGRLPIFQRDLRALLLSEKKFDYDKAHLGSYKDFIPSHYVYGYFYTTFMRNEKGDLFLSQIADDATRSSYNPLTFYNSYEDLTGESFESFYANTLRSLVQEWSNKLEKIALTPYEVKSLPRSHGWTNYLFPQKTTEGKLFALKKGLSYVEEFILIDGSREESVLFPAPLMTEYPYKLRKDRFAFVELDIDPRWGYQDFSRLKVYDLKQKRFLVDIGRSKWRLATIDHQGQLVVVVEWNEKQEQSVIVLDLNGKILHKHRFPSNEVITSIDWLNSEEVVMVLKDHNDLKSLFKLNFVTGANEVLIKDTLTNWGFVSVYEDHILLESPQTGIDNIFLYHQGSLTQLTSSKYGAYAPLLVDGELIYNDYSAEGMNIVQKKMPWKDDQETQDSFTPFFEKFVHSEKFSGLQSDLMKQELYEVKEYSQFKNAVNLHSWLILAPPLSTTVTLVGVSRDVLNNFSLLAGGGYNLNEKTSDVFVSAIWSHFYPVYDLSASYGGRKQELLKSGEKIENSWEEGRFEGGVQVPWNRVFGRFSQNFTVRSFARIIKVLNKISDDPTEINDGTLFSPGAEITYSLLSRQARRDLNPSLGVSFNFLLEEGTDITGDDQSGRIQSYESRYFLPGLDLHHSFYHQLAYERQRDRAYQYESQILYPRGTDDFFLDELLKYSGNYLMPLFYPDWNLSRYLYLRRVSLNLFYDRLTGRAGSLDYTASSTGWETLIEVNLFRLALPLTFGVRGSYILEGKREDNYEFFFSTINASF
jgi:hypothetical protein